MHLRESVRFQDVALSSPDYLLKLLTNMFHQERESNSSMAFFCV